MAGALDRARTFTSLIRWLGPWTPETRVPEVDVELVAIDGPRPFTAKLFRPRGKAGSWNETCSATS